jgi:DNA helicase-2/ATP-dependent DNA helicase PcrA
LPNTLCPGVIETRGSVDSRNDEGLQQALGYAYEAQLADDEILDYNDLIMRAVILLRDGAGAREQWQGRFDQLLVDEYQDIEPAQELLVRILAAPQDNLFVVGDEDQVLYGWRRASVERIVDLDHYYPGLQRIALDRNYRCPEEVVTRSRVLIEGNRRRFLQSPPRPSSNSPADQVPEAG